MEFVVVRSPSGESLPGDAGTHAQATPDATLVVIERKGIGPMTHIMDPTRDIIPFDFTPKRARRPR